MSNVDMWRSKPTDLLQLAELKVDKAQDIPLWLEFHVDPDTAPFLITSTRSWLWVTPRRNIIRVGTRFLDIANLYMEIVDEVANTGVASLWGNVHPLTPDGIQQAIEYVQSYDLPDVELLVSPDFDPKIIKDVTIPITVCDWMRHNHAVLLPRDRAYVGFAMTVKNGIGVCMLHNPSRSLAICR